MGGRLIDSDPLTGSSAHFHYDHTTDEAIVEERHDVTDLLAENRANANEIDGTAMRSMECLARIPPNVYAQWEAEWEVKGLGEVERQADLLRKIHDPDNSDFRIRRGRFF